MFKLPSFRLTFLLLTALPLFANSTEPMPCNHDMLIYYQIALLLLLIMVPILVLSYINQLKQTRALQESEDDLLDIAYFDPLTHLPNRNNIETVLVEQINRCQRHEKNFYLTAITIDDFATLQSTYNKRTMDRFIVELSDQLFNSIRNEDMVGHVADDSFIIIFNEYLDDRHLDLIFERIRTTLEAPYTIGTATLESSISIGVSNYPENATSSKELIACAENASQLNHNSGHLYTTYDANHS